ncbi:hypothetical protein [Cryptosporidium hominis TU502]|nr:hypothetical protein [Cryptosporidium hominis TU502]
MQIGDPRMWNSFVKHNKKEKVKVTEKKKKICLTRAFANTYNIPVIKQK